MTFEGQKRIEGRLLPSEQRAAVRLRLESPSGHLFLSSHVLFSQVIGHLEHAVTDMAVAANQRI